MNSIDQAEAYGHNQIHSPSQSWKGLCQSFVRHCYGVQGWADTAYDAWLRIPDAHKHSGGHESEAPRGAALYFKHASGDPRPGHVVLATVKNCLSNDIARSGMIDIAPRDIFIKKWNMQYLGYSLWTPFGSVK